MNQFERVLELPLTDSGMFLLPTSEHRTVKQIRSLKRATTFHISTNSAIKYTACWQLVFIHIRLFVIYLALFSCHCQPAPTYQRSTNLFCFFERGQS